MDRTDAFEAALAVLRDRLREGVYAPGTRVPASRIAQELQLSATPVREALSRLAGEGLVEERRHQGFFVRALTGLDIADLYRLSLAQLLLVHAQRGTTRGPAPTIAARVEDPVGAAEQLFLSWMADAASTALMGFYQTLTIQLGPVRRVEPLVLDALQAEAEELLALAAPELAPQRLPVLRRFHGRRIAAADRLSAVINRRNRRESL